MTRSIGLTLIALGVPLALAACGESTSDRALSGGGIGAAVGAVGGALVGSPLAGAAIGGAVGAGTGALTTPDQVDLGKPVWRGSSSSSGARASSATYDPGTVRNIQTGLRRLGYDPGPADGHVGTKTQQAIRSYERDNDLPVDGQPSAAVWDHIRARTSG